MLAIKFSLWRVTRAVILHAIYYLSKQGIEFDYIKGALKSLVKAEITLHLPEWKEPSFQNRSDIKAGKGWNLFELSGCRRVPGE